MKNLHISPQSQTLIELLLLTFYLRNLFCQISLKQKTRISKTSSFQLCSNFWLINLKVFLQALACFENITALLYILTRKINIALKQSIFSALTFAVTFTLASFCAKHNYEFQSLCKIFQKKFLLKKIRLPSPDTQISNNMAIIFKTILF